MPLPLLSSFLSPSHHIISSGLPAPIARGSFAARTGMARVFKARGPVSEGVRSICISLLLFFRGGRKMLEHFVHAFVEVLSVLVRLVGERIARGASPDQFLRLCVEEIDDQG